MACKIKAAIVLATVDGNSLGSVQGLLNFCTTEISEANNAEKILSPVAISVRCTSYIRLASPLPLMHRIRIHVGNQQGGLLQHSLVYIAPAYVIWHLQVVLMPLHASAMVLHSVITSHIVIHCSGQPLLSALNTRLC